MTIRPSSNFVFRTSSRLLLCLAWTRGFLYRTSTRIRQPHPSPLSVSTPNEKTDLLPRRDDKNNQFHLTETHGPFNISSPLFQKHWGRQPLLWRQAFNADDASSFWPTELEMRNLIYDSASGARLVVQQTPGQLDSFQLYSSSSFPSLPELLETKNPQRWTILVNDVDYSFPRLADWMDRTFTSSSLLPRWRRDDAQVSLAGPGGGIGPHLDHYDVFLVQTQGQREWRVVTSEEDGPLSMSKEQWIPNMDVAILDLDNMSSTTTAVATLNPGDCLYIPPRWIHWGTAVMDNNNTLCQTLSVGCRAPGAAELVALIAEHIPAHTRYGGYDNSTARNSTFPSLTVHNKNEMKQLVREAVEAVLNDESTWDALVGQVVTEPVRYNEDLYPDDDDDVPSLREIMQKQPQGGAIQRTPGMAMATSRVKKDDGYVDRFYATGNSWELHNEPKAASLFHTIESGSVIPFSDLALLQEATFGFVETLLNDGVLQVLERDDLIDEED